MLPFEWKAEILASLVSCPRPPKKSGYSRRFIARRRTKSDRSFKKPGFQYPSGAKCLRPWPRNFSNLSSQRATAELARNTQAWIISAKQKATKGNQFHIRPSTIGMKRDPASPIHLLAPKCDRPLNGRECSRIPPDVHLSLE